MGIPARFKSLEPALRVPSTEQKGKEGTYLGDQTAFQHERHPPSRQKTSGSGKPRYGLPDAPLAVVRSSPL